MPIAKQIPCAGQNGRRIHADDSTSRIDQRAAGVAGVERGVGLDNVVDQAAGIGTEGTPECADHACRYRGLKSVGIADGDYELSDAKLLGIAKGSGGEAGFVNTRIVEGTREIASRIVSNGSCRHAAPIGQRDLDAARVMDDVAVGKNQAIGSENKSRAAAPPFARLAGASAAGGLMHFNVHNRRTDEFHRAGYRAGIGVEQGVVRSRGTGRRDRASGFLSPAVHFGLIHRGLGKRKKYFQNVPTA